MKKQTKQKYLDQLLTLLLFTVFLTSVLLVLLTGADVVNKLSARDQKNYNQRTTIQYLATRIRQADQRGMISVSTMGDSDAFVIKEVIDDTPYETWIYCYDGYLCELFSESGMELEAEYGEYILPLSSFIFLYKKHFRSLRMNGRIVLSLRYAARKEYLNEKQCFSCSNGTNGHDLGICFIRRSVPPGFRSV